MLPPKMAPIFSGLLFTCLLLSGLAQGQKDLPSARSSCPDGFALHGSYCYGLLGIMNKETWNSAELQCQAYPSGHLAFLLNQAEADFVAAMINEYPVDKLPVWIGLHDPNKNRRWKWSSSSLFLFQAWEDKAPSSEKAKTCTVLTNDTGYQKWRDESCDQKHYFLCKFRS
ncbi:lithostathine-2-like [Gracilinanus agilis]|uniref:lithostathine-2-like n=1 Tax=Gracilinanus agilis TaxID=191870 RepID=UPI001CFDD02C|nr:lithostathine-2-like [Gracilinanus agilis]XP_044541079.1 lithostathine-2-like [Gracilinanus agilis]